MLLGAAGVILVGVTFGLWAWQQVEQTRALQTELDTWQQEHQVIKAQLVALQDGVAALEDRLAMLEADNQTRQEAAPQQATELLATLEASAALDEMKAMVSGLEGRLDSLTMRINALEPTSRGGASSLPTEVHLAVARQRQSYNLSCESSAASMVAQYHGVPLSEARILALLPRNGNPHLGFRGDLNGPIGSIEDYGVYAGPILDILNNQGLRAWIVEDGLEGIKVALARGNPVLAWVTYNCQPSVPTTTIINGQEVTLVPFQHVVVVTGYNSEGVWANDPWDGQEDLYPAVDFERSMGYFGNMAIEVAAP